MRSLSSSIAVPHIEERFRSVERLGGMPAVLRTGLDRLAVAQIVEHALETLRRQILVIVLVDLDDGGVDASAQTFDLAPGEHAVLGDVPGSANHPPADRFQRVGI